MCVCVCVCVCVCLQYFYCVHGCTVVFKGKIGIIVYYHIFLNNLLCT